MALELTVLRVAWTFNLAFDEYMLAGVIWMIGWCMVAMAAIVHLPVWLIGVVGVAIVAGHNVVDLYSAAISRRSRTRRRIGSSSSCTSAAPSNWAPTARPC